VARSPSKQWMVKASGPEAVGTRGKTAAQRLRRLDMFLAAFDSGLLKDPNSVVVDLGYGRLPITTAEWFGRLKTRWPHIRMIGVERDPERVSAAHGFMEPGLCFRRGDFRIPIESGEEVRLIRAMNVLRQYDEDAAFPAHRQILAQAAPGALLAEGTCDPLGRTMAVQLLRTDDSGNPISEGLLLATSFHEPLDPRLFQAVLPKHLIHRVVPKEPIFDFFEAWIRAAEITRSQSEFGAKQHFVAAAEALSTQISGVDVRRAWLRKGWLLWRHAPYTNPS
jgi:hypothetical protein